MKTEAERDATRLLRAAWPGEFRGSWVLSPVHDEIYANEFAACLLMPEEEVKGLRELGMDDLEMALHLKVSRQAIQFRLKNLGLELSALQET